MRVLMFGWEFPPHISGGLGTACFGLTKGLKSLGDVEVIFVVPKAYGDEDQNNAKIVAAGDVSVRTKKVSQQTETHSELITSAGNQLWKENLTFSSDNLLKDLTYIEVASLLMPYMSPLDFEHMLREKKLEGTKFFINKHGKLVYLEEGVEKEISTHLAHIVETDEEGRYKFTGQYGPNLLFEVSKYAEVAGKIATQYDFDVIHAHDWLTYLAGIAAKKATGKPLVIHVHATEYDRTGENVNQLVYDIERMGMQAADRIITVSNLTKNIVVERYGVDAEKVITVYNAVEPQKVERQSYKKNVKEKVVTFLGRVTFQKGPEYFVEACYKVHKKEKDVRFVMAGSGDMLHRMIRRAAALHICDRFHFTDFLRGDDVTRMFALSDVYVMPSVSEPFGISPLEAMRSNVPVIISKQSGVAEILNHAIKVDFWDVDAMADAIHGLLKYNALSDMFSRLGRAEVESLKWENAARQVRNVYSEAMHGLLYQ